MRRNLIPDTWTADGDGALPELGPCPHDNSCVGCRGTEMATSRFFTVEFDDIVEVYKYMYAGPRLLRMACISVAILNPSQCNCIAVHQPANNSFSIGIIIYL